MHLSMTVVILTFATCFLVKIRTVDAFPPLNRVKVTVVSEDGITKEMQVIVHRAHFEGSYYVGNGLGMNLYLSLLASGQFTCKWTGCIGDYGSSSGTWKIQPNGIVLNAQKAEGLLEDRPITQLNVIQYQQHFLLRDERYSGYFSNSPIGRSRCFHQEKARKSIDDFVTRQIQKEVQDKIEKSKKK
ncbi:MAG: hypothetical protein U0796_03970 [Gemmatales bacterium]